jgi:S1-C subfamily serine protease
MHSGGVTSVEFEELPEALQKRYHFDAGKAAAAKAQRAADEKHALEQRNLVTQEAAALPSASPPSDPDLKAFEAMRVGRLEDAHQWLQSAAQADPSRDLYSEIDNHITAIIDALKNYFAAQQELQKLVPEIERIRHNAAIADRPNVLIPYDNSNQVRAKEMREKAEQMHRDAEAQREEARKGIENELRLVDSVAEKQKANGAFSVALDLTEMIENIAERLPIRDFRTAIGKGEQSSLRERAVAASRQLQSAEVLIQNKKLWAAHQVIQQGLKEEPGQYELQILSDGVDKKLDECGSITGEALSLKANKQYERAIEKTKTAEADCIDQPDTERLAYELSVTISEKEKRLTKAKADEEAGDFETALRAYDTYGIDDAVKRVTPKLAKTKERQGDFMSAYELYQRASMPGEMQRIRQPRDEQTSAYRSAKTLIAQGKFDEAVTIFAKYGDVLARNDVLLQKAAFLEGDQKFDQAIEVYSEAGASFETARVRALVADKQKILTDAQNQERAAKYDGALELFTKANSRPDIQRVAGTMAREFEKRQDYASAAEYYEAAGLYDDAGRIRRSHNLTKSSPRGSFSDTEIFKRCAPACVTIVSGNADGAGLGSGFFVAKNGYILTNHHVVRAAEVIKVITSSDKVLEATVVGESDIPDLALLQASIRDNPVIDIGDSDGVETGAHVSAIGTPKRLAQSFTAGSISSTDREMFGNKCFQISVLLNHGNSGGPLLDERGKAIGVNTFSENTLFMDRDTGMGVGSDIQGINYSVKINEAKRLLGEIKRYGRGD